MSSARSIPGPSGRLPQRTTLRAARRCALLAGIFARRCALLAGIVAALAVTACDESFAPITPSALQFSTFGYLDAAADTQWIRVMPIRPLILTAPDSFGATVTLEHLGTGQIIEMRDSVFLFTHHLHPEIGSEGVYLHNFWTTETIEPGATYRFSARREGEEPAEAVVEIPHDFWGEVWYRAIPEEPTDFLDLAGLKHVAFLTATTFYRDQCGPGMLSVTFRPPSADGQVPLVPLNRVAPVPPREGCGGPIVEKRELSVIGAETEWPTGSDHSPWSLVPEAVSNITNSVGFLGGGLTRVIPYEGCAFQGGGPVPSHCQVSYDPASAGVSGGVRETRCGNGPLDSVIVQLRELDREPSPVRKIRTTTSTLSGQFEIAGLEPGMRYLVSARARQILVPGPGPPGSMIAIDTHTRHTDTLEFTPAERRNYDIGLEYLNPCGLAP